MCAQQDGSTHTAELHGRAIHRARATAAGRPSGGITRAQLTCARQLRLHVLVYRGHPAEDERTALFIHGKHRTRRGEEGGGEGERPAN